LVLIAEHIEKHSHMLELLGSGIVTCILLIILVRKVRPALVSPVYGLVFVYLGVFILGALFYDPGYGTPGMYMSEEEAIKVLSQIFWIVSAFMAGVALFATVSKRRAQLRRPINSISAIRLSRLQTLGALVVGIGCIVLTVIGVGAGNLWYRREYLVQENQTARILGAALVLPCGLALGLVAGQERSRARLPAFAILGVFVALMAALSTRAFALLPVLFCLGCLLAQPKNAKVRAALVITLLLTPFSMIVPLATRAMPEQGFSTLPKVFEVLTLNNLGDQFLQVLNNVLVTVPITIDTAQAFVSDAAHYLLVGLDPRPGIWAGWYDEVPYINAFTPYNAIGDLLRAGIWIAMLYYMFVGMYFARAEARLRSASRVGPGQLLTIGITFGFIVLSIQYPLRSATRLIYYMIVIDVFGQVAFRLAPKVQSRLTEVWSKQSEFSSSKSF
jgi:hypothetical protein